MYPQCLGKEDSSSFCFQVQQGGTLFLATVLSNQRHLAPLRYSSTSHRTHQSLIFLFCFKQPSDDSGLKMPHFIFCEWLRSRYGPAWPRMQGQGACTELATLEPSGILLTLDVFSSGQTDPSGM